VNVKAREDETRKELREAPRSQKQGFPRLRGNTKGPPEIRLVAYADFRFREKNESGRSGRRRWMSLLNSRQENLEALAFVALSRPLPAALEA